MKTYRLVVELICAGIFFGLLAELVVRAVWALLEHVHRVPA